MVTWGMVVCPFSGDPDDLGEREPADSRAGERGDRVRQGWGDGGDGDLADAGRLLGRLDQMHLDLRDGGHSHERVAVEVLGDDVAAFAEHDLAPRRGAEPEEQPAFDLSADQVRVDGDAAVQREHDPLDMDAPAVVEGYLGDVGAVAEEARAR